ncbi:hypothetical protein [Leptolyngbya ohadii]|uniref:hypothetical protein n=1 Tax=Leptolyngbya ohadii TaxID=1962290 RepID=UPI000B5A0F27|nr:hypothetical protein [Leptolyngbya ohadii]
MPKKFSETLKLPDNLRNDLVGQKLHILNAQTRQHKEQTAARERALQILEQAIALLDELIELPPTRRIRINSRIYSDFPLESADRRELLRIPTNRPYEIQEKWMPLLEAKILPYAGQPDPPLSLIHLD